MTQAEKKSIRVRNTILDIEHALETQTPAQVSTQFAEFQKEFPKIFDTVLKGNYNRGFMAMMLDQMDKIEEGKTNQHEASVAVGQMLVDNIVKPQLRSSGKKV